MRINITWFSYSAAETQLRLRAVWAVFIMLLLLLLLSLKYCVWCAATTLFSTPCRIWQSEEDANATAMRHVVVCRHATDDSAVSVDTIQSAQIVRGVDRSIMTDRGPERLQQEQTNVSVSQSVYQSINSSSLGPHVSVILICSWRGERRKSGVDVTSQSHNCTICGRGCAAAIGLYSHMRTHKHWVLIRQLDGRFQHYSIFGHLGPISSWFSWQCDIRNDQTSKKFVKVITAHSYICN